MFKKLLNLFKKEVDISKTHSDIERMASIIEGAYKDKFENKDTPIKIIWGPESGTTITHNGCRVYYYRSTPHLSEYGLNTDIWFKDFVALYILADEYINKRDIKKKEFNEQLYESYVKMNKILSEKNIP